MVGKTLNQTEKVYDAMLTLKAYCSIKKCDECCINTNGYCQLRDSRNAPVHWDISMVADRAKKSRDVGVTV